MRLADKMFSRSNMRCPLRSECRADANRKYFGRLFERKWEVFVIKRDNKNDKFDWFTLCCEVASAGDHVPKHTAATCR